MTIVDLYESSYSATIEVSHKGTEVEFKTGLSESNRVFNTVFHFRDSIGSFTKELILSK